MAKEKRPVGMDKSNSCMSGCGAFLVLGGAALLVIIASYNGLSEYKSTGVRPADNDAVQGLYAIGIILMGIAIFMARKSRIT